ncbi:MAG: radical SAM protein [Clostridia bacterium]|nr:radical SAM protein [Clostridia bacterium]
MQIIREPFAQVNILLGEQSAVTGDTYHGSVYVIREPIDDGVLVYNVLTGELILLTKEEAAIFDGDVTFDGAALSETLIHKWYFIANGQSEQTLCDDVRAFLKSNVKPGSLRGYTIFATMDCNARCFYCFEHGQARTPMSAETAADVADYILRTHVTEPVKLHWFGGEPLVNMQAMDIITTRLKEHGVDYISDMVSNGYLFDDDTVKKAVELWKLYRVQVPIDGTEAVYNKIKAYIYRDGRSAFQIVISNVERLIRAGVDVVIRLNMSDTNVDDLYELTRFLIQRFAGMPHWSVYAHLLYDTPQSPYSPERHLRNAKRLVEFQRFCMANRIAYMPNLPNRLKLNRCGADSPAAALITPTGALTLCEHFTETNLAGTIYEGVTDPDIRAAFAKVGNNPELCNGCPLYPSCVKLVRCPTRPYICDAADRYMEEAIMHDRMITTYLAYKKANTTL